MSTARLEAEITELAGHLAAGECRWVSFLAEYDRREGWREWGCRTCAFWLSWKCGLDIRSAQEKLRVAHALTLFPRIRAEFAAGRLTYSKVRALTRMATPESEEALVDIGLCGTAAHIEALARGYRRVERHEDRRDAVTDPARGRGVQFVDDDGATVMIVRLTEEETEQVRRALDHAGDGVSTADALVLMAESYLANGDACRTGSDRALLVVNTDEKVLTGDNPELWPTIEGGPAILPETVRRLACDASFVWLLRGENGEPVNISAKFAGIPRALRRLVRARDQGRCRFPGCDEARYTDIHHLVHRARSGPNTATNLVTLCWFHHRLVHEGGWTLTRTTNGELVATNPDGAQLTADVPVPVGSAEVVRAENCERGITIDATTTIPQWHGDHFDLGHAVTGLWYKNHPEALARFAEQARGVAERAA
jgi:hypothetical protein